MDDVQRLYLKLLLNGEAEQLTTHVNISESNYKRCWELLNDRYENISHHILLNPTPYKKAVINKSGVNEQSNEWES